MPGAQASVQGGRALQRSSHVIALVGLLALSSMLYSKAAPVTASAASLPTGLPRHFGIGLAAGPDENGVYGWMPNSSIPWDYAYQYLNGGVKPGRGWNTWNPDGQFA